MIADLLQDMTRGVCPAGLTPVDQINLFNDGCGPYPEVMDPVDACEDEQVFVFPSTHRSGWPTP